MPSSLPFPVLSNSFEFRKLQMRFAFVAVVSLCAWPRLSSASGVSARIALCDSTQLTQLWGKGPRGNDIQQLNTSACLDVEARPFLFSFEPIVILVPSTLRALPLGDSRVRLFMESSLFYKQPCGLLFVEFLSKIIFTLFIETGHTWVLVVCRGSYFVA